MPEFPGGTQALYGFINKNIKEVELENRLGIEGKVYVKFLIDTNGAVSNVELEKGLDYAPGYNAEALRVIKLLPNWKPATIDSKPTKVSFSIPISFKPSNTSTPESYSIKNPPPDYKITMLKEKYKDWIPPNPKKDEIEIIGTATYYDNDGKYFKDEKWKYIISQYNFQPSYANGVFKNKIHLQYAMKSIPSGTLASKNGPSHSITLAEKNDLIYVEVSYSVYKKGIMKKTAEVLKKDIIEISKGHYMLAVSNKEDDFKLSIELIKEGDVFKRIEAVSIDYGLKEAYSFKTIVVLTKLVPTQIN